MHIFDVGSVFTDHSMDEESWIIHFLGLHLYNHLPKDISTIKKTFKVLKQQRWSMYSMIKIIQLKYIQYTKQKSFQCIVLNQDSHCHEDINVYKQNHVLSSPKSPHLQVMKFLLECRDTNYAGVNSSMTRGSIMDAESHHGMRVDKMKQSCAEYLFAWKKKWNR